VEEQCDGYNTNPNPPIASGHRRFTAFAICLSWRHHGAFLLASPSSVLSADHEPNKCASVITS
jgi:hypothetical protein